MMSFQAVVSTLLHCLQSHCSIHAMLVVLPDKHRSRISMSFSAATTSVRGNLISPLKAQFQMDKSMRLPAGIKHLSVHVGIEFTCKVFRPRSAPMVKQIWNYRSNSSLTSLRVTFTEVVLNPCALTAWNLLVRRIHSAQVARQAQDPKSEGSPTTMPRWELKDIGNCSQPGTE